MLSLIMNNSDQQTTLNWASYNGQLDVVNRLLDYNSKNNAFGIDVNLQNKNGDTALIEASRMGLLDVVKKLEDYHKNQIQEGFDLVNDYERKFNTLYICTDIVELVIDFTV